MRYADRVAEFRLSDEQRAFQQRVGDLARTKLRAAAASGEPGRVNRPLLRAMGELGLLRGLFGGEPDEPPRDAAALRLCLLRESIAQVSGEAETALALQGLGSYPILQSGSPELVEQWIPKVISGEAVAAFALSEPNAGSDAAALELRAEPDGDGWRLTGEKIWISNAPDADIYTVFARTTPNARARGVTAFVVPGDSPGLSGEPLDMLSPHPIGRLVFDGVPVGPRRRARRGRRRIRGGHAHPRPVPAQRRRVRGRHGAGRAGRHGRARPATHGRTAHRWPTSRRSRTGSPTWRPSWKPRDCSSTRGRRLRRGRRTGTAGAALGHGQAVRDRGGAADHRRCGATARRAALRSGHLLEHLYRDVRSLRIYEGASEIQRSIIARDLIGRDHTR